MPKIPLYNQGLGSAIDVKPVQVVRANEGAFTAAQKGFTALGETIQDVSFKFGMMEKQQETERKTNEEATRLRDAADNFNMSNQDTDTESYVNNFKKFQTQQMASVEKNIANLTRTQKESIRNSLNNIFSSKMAAGKQQAWGKGLSMKKTAVDAELESLARDISMISKKSLLRNIRISEANEKIKQSQIGGYASKFSEATFMSTIIGSDYASEIQLAKTPAEVKAIRERAAKDAGLSAGQFEKIVAATNSREAKAEVEQFENVVGMLASASDEVTKSELDTARKNIMNDEPFTIGGTTYVTKDMGLSGPNRIKLANVVDTLGKDKFDTVANNAVATLNNSLSQNKTEVVLSDVSNMYSPDMLAKNGITEDDVDKFLIESAQQGIDNIARLIDANEITDIPAAMETISKVEAMLTTDSSGRGSLVSRVGTIGDSTDTILKAAAKAKKDINKAVETSSLLSTGEAYFRAGKWPTINQSEFKPKEVQALIAKSFIGKDKKPIPVSQQLTLLERNNERFEMFAQSLGQGRSVGLAGGFLTVENEGAPEGIKGDTAQQSEGFKIVEKNLRLYKLMQRYPSVLTKHTTEDDRAFYDAVDNRLGYESLETAINNVSQANRLKIDVKPKYKQVSEKVDKLSGSVSDASWLTSLFTDKPTKVMNTAYVQNELQKRTEQRIRLGTDPKIALDLAAEDMKRTHAFVRGTFVKMGDQMPANIQMLSDMAVDNALKAHPYLSEEVEKDELSIIQYGDPNSWALVVGGANPLEDRDGRVIIYTTEQLNNFFDADYNKKKQQNIKEFNQTKQNKQDAMLSYEDFATPDDIMLMQSGQGIYDGPSLTEFLSDIIPDDFMEAQIPEDDKQDVPDIVRQSSMFRMQSGVSRRFGTGGSK